MTTPVITEPGATTGDTVTTGQLVGLHGEVLCTWTTDDDAQVQAAAAKFADLARHTVIAPTAPVADRATTFDPTVESYTVVQRLVGG